ncbi:MAG TPA: hemerythrin domain-containing protein [Actinophytocola sp.]|uniref:hemerythrin domain-containing protein n=1 Tax=Actinophytocola sp. TaxID=1872138 RepID=UPI002DBA2B73|nr:hemerythrin domain-containing protein [Actinophytocola sp.]HEU5472463.1 hemerythrin domain-containing protein [Actinophytocola sp.]
MSTDAIVLLREDHKEIRRLFREFQSANTPARKAAAVRRILPALATYRQREDECLYPQVRTLLPDLDQRVLENSEQHHVAEALCAELATMNPDDERFTAKTTVLIETVTRHITGEEQDWFPQVRKGLGRKQLQDVGARMIALRKNGSGKKKPARTAPTNGAAPKNAAPKDAVPVQDVVDLLIQQHTQIRDLFLEVEKADGEAKREAFHRLVRLLAVHETAEEQAVHPVARLHLQGGGDIVDARLAEEHQAKETLAALEEMGPDAPEFPRLLAELRASVLEHASHEEAYEFRYLRRDVPAAELRALVKVVKAAEAIAPTHPHPGIESATANTLAGPALSLFDRTKDLVHNTIGKG